jgi:hypothetical protein
MGVNPEIGEPYLRRFGRPGLQPFKLPDKKYMTLLAPCPEQTSAKRCAKLL